MSNGWGRGVNRGTKIIRRMWETCEEKQMSDKTETGMRQKSEISRSPLSFLFSDGLWGLSILKGLSATKTALETAHFFL